MDNKGGLHSALKWIGRLIPGNFLKTFVYLNAIAAPRRLMRKSIGTFYRIDHIYEVLKEFKKSYKGKFSILEFGVADGYSFTKKLYAVRYMNMEDRVVVHGFDTFEGLPAQTSPADNALVRGEEWIEGHYHGRYDELLTYCESKYTNFRLHKGLFEETLTEEWLPVLEEYLPILIWIDCDYYSSTKSIFERIIPYIPTGCVVYFDDLFFNYGSRFTGEMKAIWELNTGAFGEGIELVLDRDLSWDSNRVFRFINMNSRVAYEVTNPSEEDPVNRRRDDSPFP